MTESRANGVIAAGIDSFTGRARVMTLAIAAATIACVVVMLAGVPGAPIREAEARSVVYNKISGTIYDANSGQRAAGAGVYLYRWNGSSWVSLGRKATTNRTGYYSISGVRSGYYYQVMASKVYGDCRSDQAIYMGSSRPRDLRKPVSTSVVASFPLYFSHWFYC